MLRFRQLWFGWFSAIVAQISLNRVQNIPAVRQNELNPGQAAVKGKHKAIWPLMVE